MPENPKSFFHEGFECRVDDKVIVEDEEVVEFEAREGDGGELIGPRELVFVVFRAPLCILLAAAKVLVLDVSMVVPPTLLLVFALLPLAIPLVEDSNICEELAEELELI